MLDTHQLDIIIREGEGLTVEFKEHFTPRISEDMVAFANTRGGLILLGVRDDKSVTGESLTNDLKSKINSIARNCNPPIQLKIKQIGDIIAVEIPQGDEKPYGCASGYFRRLDGTTQKMTNHELRVMFSEYGEEPFEDRINKSSSWEDISKQKIQTFLKEADISLRKIVPQEIMASLNVARLGKITNAGVLFFAKVPWKFIFHSQMTLIAFKGKDRVHIYDRSDVRDDLLTQFNEAVAFLKKHLNIRSEIRGFDREDIYEIPLEVLREALVNALMHRDYGITGTQVSVEVYDDRVEIVNPGGLPKGLSVQDLGKVSVRRNELIADLFFRLHKVERIGLGIQKMKDSMKAAGLREPTFVPNAFFRAIFYRSPEFALKEGDRSPKLVEGLADKLVERLVEGLAENQKKVLILIARNSRISKKAMAQSLGISTTAIDKNLTALKQKGLLKRIGPDKGGYWEVVEIR